MFDGGGALQEFGRWSRATLFHDMEGGVGSGMEVDYRRELVLRDWGAGQGVGYGREFG